VKCDNLPQGGVQRPNLYVRIGIPMCTEHTFTSLMRLLYHISVWQLTSGVHIDSLITNRLGWDYIDYQCTNGRYSCRCYKLCTCLAISATLLLPILCFNTVQCICCLSKCFNFRYAWQHVRPSILRRFWRAPHDCVAPYVDIILHRGQF